MVLQPISRDPKEKGVAAMLGDRTFYFAIQHCRHAIVFLDLQELVADHLFLHFCLININIRLISTKGCTW